MKKLASIPLFLFLLFSGCQKDNSLLPPEQTNANSLQKPAWVLAAEKQGLTLIALPHNASSALDKNFTVEQIINHSVDGTLAINETYLSSINNLVSVNASLLVQANALAQDATLTMNFEDEYLCFEFGPSGTTFATPALLNVEVTGLDLSAFGTLTTGHLRYYNESLNEWSIVEADEVAINTTTGTFSCKNGKIPHFSRYGFTN